MFSGKLEGEGAAGSRCEWGGDEKPLSARTLVTAQELSPQRHPSALLRAGSDTEKTSQLLLFFLWPSPCLCGEILRLRYSRTLSSSFLRPQSAAAWTKARMTGCGFFSVEDNCGWKRVAMKKR